MTWIGTGFPGGPLPHPVVVHGPVVDRQGVVGHQDFPHLRDILQSRHEALARRCRIDRAHSGALTLVVVHRDQLQGLKVPGVQDHQAVGQIVGYRHVAPIPGHRQVAGMDAGAELRHGLEAVQVELGDLSVA
jgi:hypothetical protein